MVSVTDAAAPVLAFFLNGGSSSARVAFCVCFWKVEQSMTKKRSFTRVCDSSS